MFATILAGVAVTDVLYYLIPDGFTVFGLGWVFATASSLCSWRPGGFALPYEALIGACVGAGVISIIGWLGEVVLKKEAMGFGDVTLMAVVGAALGAAAHASHGFRWRHLGRRGFSRSCSPLCGSAVAGTGRPFEPPLVPFGVFLAPAALITFLWGNRLIAWYLARLGLPDAAPARCLWQLETRQ